MPSSSSGRTPASRPEPRVFLRPPAGPHAEEKAGARTSATPSPGRCAGCGLIPLRWIKSYHRKLTTAKPVLRGRDSVSRSSSDLKIVDGKSTAHVNKAVGYFKFNRIIEQSADQLHQAAPAGSILQNQERHRAAHLHHIDLMLLAKTHYERRTKDLFTDLGLRTGAIHTGSTSRYRKQLKRAVAGTPGRTAQPGVLKLADD